MAGEPIEQFAEHAVSFIVAIADDVEGRQIVECLSGPRASRDSR